MQSKNFPGHKTQKKKSNRNMKITAEHNKKHYHTRSHAKTIGTRSCLGLERSHF